MSVLANWSYTAKATVWRVAGENEYGAKTYHTPEIIDCDYGSGRSKSLGDIGAQIVVKNTFWTEYSLAKIGDYILLGESTELNPVAALADEIKLIQRFADTFARKVDDFALITAV